MLGRSAWGHDGQLIEDPATQVNGIVMVEDMGGISFSLMSHMRAQDPDQIGLKWMQVRPRTAVLGPVRPALLSLTHAPSLPTTPQDCFPVRFKGIHVINQPWYLSVLMAIIRPFMSKKLAERVRSHVPISTWSYSYAVRRCLSLVALVRSDPNLRLGPAAPARAVPARNPAQGVWRHPRGRLGRPGAVQAVLGRTSC